MMRWFKRKKKEEPQKPERVREGFFSTHRESDDSATATEVLQGKISHIANTQPVAQIVGTMDSMDGGGALQSSHVSGGGTVSDSLFMWYANSNFIGHTMCAIIAQHWLIYKACAMPGRDAIRQGYTIQGEGGEELDPDALKLLKRYDKKMNINKQMRDFVTFGRIFGVRVALFRVESDDSEYYQNPFNEDGVTENSYKGVVQIDPHWCTPDLDAEGLTDPTSPNFYNPTHWLINGKRYHRSHLMIFIPNPVANILKPGYLFGGVPVPQKIMERVYASERTANEAPQLALSKRTTIFKTDAAKALSNESEFNQNMATWIKFRDNFGVKIVDREEDSIEQFDTSLADFDALIMTQYQLVAAGADVPATKLLETQPKGWASSGEYEEASYREGLESLQTHDLTPLLERHHLLLMRSHVAPELNIKPVETCVNWESLDSPTAKEYAEINEINSRADLNLVNSGALDQYDVRDRLIADKNSGYSGIAPAEPPTEGDLPTPTEGGGNGENTEKNGETPTA